MDRVPGVPNPIMFHSDIKHVLHEDAVLALNFEKTKILVTGISAADAHAAATENARCGPCTKIWVEEGTYVGIHSRTRSPVRSQRHP
jgi:hypothetical protein